jgi:hypothetical protein
MGAQTADRARTLRTIAEARARRCRVKRVLTSAHGDLGEGGAPEVAVASVRTVPAAFNSRSSRQE